MNYTTSPAFTLSLKGKNSKIHLIQTSSKCPTEITPVQALSTTPGDWAKLMNRGVLKWPNRNAQKSTIGYNKPHHPTITNATTQTKNIQ